MNFDIRVKGVNAVFYAFDSAVEYTTKLQRERHAMQDEADQLRKQIQDLNTSIRYYVIYIDDRFLSSHYFAVQSGDISCSTFVLRFSGEHKAGLERETLTT